ncbi:MAG TPA: lipid-binding SYLF domain-containing protein [Steroidobacteraceae bacterium]|nr:lipid-binding SYLF domain-containing protein [Steroidobacteraceae bacterium]
MKPVNIFAIASFASLSLCISAAAVADTKAEIDAHVNESLKQFHALNSNNQSLENKAAGVLIFPSVTKGGVGIAGEYGEGVLKVKGKTVGYYSVTSASVGLTIGVGTRSEILMFNTQAALNNFTSSKGWSIGADAGVAVLSKGGGGDYDTQTLQKPIVGFVYGEKGLIADLSLEGSKINKLDK